MNEIFIIMTGNIYTLAIIAVPIYFFFYLVKKIIKIIPHPGIPTAVIMIPLFIFGASYDRVLFDKKIKNTQDNFSFLKTYDVTYWGAIHEPMTWFKSYIGFIRLTTPKNPSMTDSYHTNFYFRQDSDPIENSIFGETYRDSHLVDCNTKYIEVFIPDKSGDMKIDTSKSFAMNEKDYDFYCIEDWSEYENEFKNYLNQ